MLASRPFGFTVPLRMAVAAVTLLAGSVTTTGGAAMVVNI